MKKTIQIRKITGASLFIIIILFVSLFIGTNGAAFAVTVDSDVYADLMQMTIDGKKFDVADYPADENGETRMLSFIEYGYSYDDAARDKFALFAYVYNPKKNVVATSGQNKIQLASAYDAAGNATEYTKYRARLRRKPKHRKHVEMRGKRYDRNRRAGTQPYILPHRTL